MSDQERRSRIFEDVCRKAIARLSQSDLNVIDAGELGILVIYSGASGWMGEWHDRVTVEEISGAVPEKTKIPG